MSRYLLTVAAGVLLLGSGAAYAQASEGTLPTDVTLEQVLSLLEQRSPRTAADRAPIAVAAADQVAARALPNPSLDYGGVHLVSGSSTGAVTSHQAVVEQPLLLFGQRKARMAEADLSLHAEEARVAGVTADRRLAVRQAFASLLARQEQLRVTEQSAADLNRVAQLVRKRADAGERSKYDVARIDTEAATLDVQVMNARADVDDAAGQLASLLGFPGWSPHAVGTLDAGSAPTDVAMLWDVAQRRRPSLVATRQRQAAARGGLFLAQRERLPVPALSAGTQVTREVNGTSAFVGVSIPLPLFDRGQGAIARANAQVTQEELAYKAELAESRAQIERAASVLAKRREALERLENGVVQRAPALRQMAEDAYREGSGDILDLLDAMRALKEIELTHVQQLETTKLADELVVSVAGLDAPEPAGRP